MYCKSTWKLKNIRNIVENLNIQFAILIKDFIELKKNKIKPPCFVRKTFSKVFNHKRKLNGHNCAASQSCEVNYLLV